MALVICSSFGFPWRSRPLSFVSRVRGCDRLRNIPSSARWRVSICARLVRDPRGSMTPSPFSEWPVWRSCAAATQISPGSAVGRERRATRLWLPTLQSSLSAHTCRSRTTQHQAKLGSERTCGGAAGLTPEVARSVALSALSCRSR